MAALVYSPWGVASPSQDPAIKGSGRRSEYSPCEDTACLPLNESPPRKVPPRTCSPFAQLRNPSMSFFGAAGMASSVSKISMKSEFGS